MTFDEVQERLASFSEILQYRRLNADEIADFMFVRDYEERMIERIRAGLRKVVAEQHRKEAQARYRALHPRNRVSGGKLLKAA